MFWLIVWWCWLKGRWEWQGYVGGVLECWDGGVMG